MSHEWLKSVLVGLLDYSKQNGLQRSTKQLSITLDELEHETSGDTPSHYGPSIDAFRTNQAARILLVEDDQAVLSILTRILKRAGHQVYPARDGNEAVKQYAQHSPIELLITDMAMPSALQGPDLIDRFRGSQPDLPAILITGYPVELEHRESEASKNRIHLTKPVTVPTLLTAVNDLLDLAPQVPPLSEKSQM